MSALRIMKGMALALLILLPLVAIALLIFRVSPPTGESLAIPTRTFTEEELEDSGRAGERVGAVITPQQGAAQTGRPLFTFPSLPIEEIRGCGSISLQFSGGSCTLTYQNRIYQCPNLSQIARGSCTVTIYYQNGMYLTQGPPHPDEPGWQEKWIEQNWPYEIELVEVRGTMGVGMGAGPAPAGTYPLPDGSTRIIPEGHIIGWLYWKEERHSSWLFGDYPLETLLEVANGTRCTLAVPEGMVIPADAPLCE